MTSTKKLVYKDIFEMAYEKLGQNQDSSNSARPLEEITQASNQKSSINEELSNGFFSKIGQSTSSAKAERFRIWYPNPYFVYLSRGPGAGKERLEEKVMPSYFDQLVDYLQKMDKLDSDLMRYGEWLEKDDLQRDKNLIKIENSSENFYHCTLIGQYALISLIIKNNQEKMDEKTKKKAVVLKIKAKKLVKNVAYGAVPGLNPKIKDNPQKMRTYVKTEFNDKLINTCIDDAAKVFQTRFRILDEVLTENYGVNFERDKRFFARAIFDEKFNVYMQRMEYLLGLDQTIKQNGGFIGPYAEMMKYVNKIKEMLPHEFDFTLPQVNGNGNGKK